MCIIPEKIVSASCIISQCLMIFFFFAHLQYLSFLQEISAIQIKKKT